MLASDSFNQNPGGSEEEEETLPGVEPAEKEKYMDPVSDEPQERRVPTPVEEEVEIEAPAVKDDDDGLAMPEPSAFYTDSALFLPVERESLRFEILRTFPQENVWYYEITITSNLPLYLTTGAKDKIVKKASFRYSRLEWFRTAMVLEYPSVVIPPVPPKDISHSADKLVGMMGTPEEADAPLLVLERKRELEYFFNYIASHPALRESTLVRDFLYCPDSEFSNFKERVTQQHQSQALSLADATRNMSYKTKSAFGWLKSKVSKKEPSKEKAQLKEYQPLVTWIANMHKMVDEIRAKLEVLYLQKVSRTDEKFPFHSTLPPTEWSQRVLRPEGIRKGMKIQSRSTGSFGVIKWSGKLGGKGEDMVGVEWDESIMGNCDGEHNGVKYFTCDKKHAGAFTHLKELVIPLPRDSVVDALESTILVVNSMLRDLRIDQERRLFYMLSDLQIARGWLESLQKCIDHLNTANLTQLSIKEELRVAEGQKKEDLTGEFELKDRLEKLQSHMELEKKTFQVETDKFRKTFAALWRGVLANYTHFNKYHEVKPGIDAAIIRVADAIETPWE